MLVQYFVAALLFAAVIAFVILLNIKGRKESRRRAALPLAERRRLDAEDALWQQRYGF